jgi:hypothetical protein
VYHGDENHPQAILEKGITPRGDSMDLLLHVLDNSNPPSGYVSTSTSADAAYAYGPYVYVIRTPSNAIDVNAALGHKSPYPAQLEFAIPGSIAGDEIRGVTFPEARVSSLNPNYRARK